MDHCAIYVYYVYYVYYTCYIRACTTTIRMRYIAYSIQTPEREENQWPPQPKTSYDESLRSCSYCFSKFKRDKYRGQRTAGLDDQLGRTE